MNILMLTSIYPAPNDINKNTTKVVNYFVEEWVKQGHDVIVIHNVHKYFSCIHRHPKKIKSKIATKMGFEIPDINDVMDCELVLNGVKVYRRKIFKLIPHGDPSSGVINRQIKRIVNILDQNNFKPDIIMGHWASPQAALICRLKDIYKCRTSLVLHGKGYYDKPKYLKFINTIDAIGCRSKTEVELLKQKINIKKEPFICYSGIPDAFVEQYEFDKSKFSNSIKKWTFIYVGRLVEYKNIDKVLIALSKLDVDFSFDIIGSGAMEDSLSEQA